MARQDVDGRSTGDDAPSFDLTGLWIAIAVAAVLFGLSWARHVNYWSGFDLAIFDQAAWQLSEGRDLISIVDRRVLADHFSPVLYLFAPIYRVAASPLWLLGAQAVAIGATVLPMRALAARLGASRSLATVLVVGSAPLLSAGLFDMHPSTLAVPFIALVVLYAVDDRPAPALLAALAVGICRADLGVVVLASALVAGRRTRAPLAAAGSVLVAAGVLLPGRVGETSGWRPHFGHLGDGPLHALVQPWTALGHLLSAGGLGILLLWIAAAGLLVGVRPRWLLAVLVAGAPILLSRWAGTELPWYHYGAPIVPLAVGGTLEAVGAGAPRRISAGARRRLPVVGVALALLLSSPLSPGAPDSNRVWSVARPRPGFDAVAALEAVRTGEVVSAHDKLLPHLSHRERLYLFPVPFGIQAGYHAEGAEPDLSQYGPDHVDVLIGAPGVIEVEAIVGYTVVAELDGLIVLRRAGG